MKNKYLFFLLFVWIIATNTTNAQTYMHIYNTGATGNYDTDNVPVITFTSTDLVVSDLGTPVPYVMDDVSKIVFDFNPISVNEELSFPFVGLYPNPTKGFVTLNVNNETATEFVVDIYNVTGSLVSSTTYASNGGVLNERVDLSSYVDGIYMVRVNSGKDVITKKIIKN